MELRYMGFEQRQNSRAFRFDVMAKGETTKQAVVTADMTLFRQFRVGIQDAPTLCAGKLVSDIENSFDGQHVLTGDDLRAHSESRAAAEERRLEARRRGPRRNTAGASSVNLPDRM